MGNNEHQQNDNQETNKRMSAQEIRERAELFFKNLREEKKLKKDGTLYVGEINSQKPIIWAIILLIPIFISIKTYSSESFSGNIFAIAFFIVLALYYYFTRRSTIHLSPEHITIKSTITERLNLCDISYITPICEISSKKGYYTIQYGEKEIQMPYNSDKNSIPYRCHQFLKEIVPELDVKIGKEPTPQAIMKLFAAIVATTGNSSSKEYAVNFLHENLWNNQDKKNISILFDSYCASGSQQIVDECLRYAKEHNYEERKELLDHLFECAFKSYGVDVNELNILQKIAKYFLIKEWDFKAMQYKYEYHKAEEEKEERKREERKKRAEYSFKNVIGEAQKTLGVKSDASFEEIKSAYRELVKKVHPDKLPANATRQEIEEASENFRIITEAYKFLEEKEQEKIKETIK